MKVSACTSLVLTAAALFASAARAEDGQPTLVTSPVEEAFAPLGFDSNDNVEVIVHGHFVNACYKVGPATGTVDYATSTITIDATAYLYAAPDCVKMLVAFDQPVSLGIVRPGTYRVIIKDVPAAVTTDIVITQATSESADDFLYAPVAQTSFKTTADGRSAVRVEGTYPYTFVGCMVMKEVRTHLTPGNVLVVQPIAELLDGGPVCVAQSRNKAFAIDTPVTDTLTTGDMLLHVRALSGRSVNRVVVLQNN